MMAAHLGLGIADCGHRLDRNSESGMPERPHSDERPASIISKHADHPMRKIQTRFVAPALAVIVATASRPAVLAAQETPSPQSAQRAAAALRDSLKATLAFLASFDHGFNADYAHGDPLIYSAPSYSKLDAATSGVANPDVVLAKAQG